MKLRSIPDQLEYFALRPKLDVATVPKGWGGSGETISLAHVRVHPPVRDFCSIYMGDNEGLFLESEHSGPTEDFELDVQTNAFDDPELIRLVQKLCHVIEKEEAIDIESMHSAYRLLKKFFVVNEGRRRSGKEIDISEEVFTGAVQFIRSIPHIIQTYGKLLSEHSHFKDLDQLLEQAPLVADMIEGIRAKEISKGTHSVSFAEKHAQYIDDAAPLTFTPHVDPETKLDVSAACAKVEFIEAKKIGDYLRYYISLGAFIQYAATCNNTDKDVYGSFPEILDADTDGGLYAEFHNLVHPYRVKNYSFPDPTLERKLSHSSYFYLKALGTDLDESLFAKEGEEEYKEKSDTPLQKTVIALKQRGIIISGTNALAEPIIGFQGGLKRQTLLDVLHELRVPKNVRKELLENYDETSFNPFTHICLSSRERIKILTGANANGKSTLMRSVALAIHTANMGRRVNASKAICSISDGIFHDFQLEDSIQDGISTFRSQLRNVQGFMKNATPKSLGLFDELYHGTSSPYLLSLAWATVEEFSRRRLRAIISTHEPLLTRSTNKNGLESVRGIFAQRIEMALENEGAIDGVSNICMKKYFELEDGSVTDSDAFKIAKEEKLPKTILERAAEIKNIVTTN